MKAWNRLQSRQPNKIHEPNKKRQGQRLYLEVISEIQKKTSPRRQKRTRSLVQAAAGARHGYGRRQRQGRQGRTGDLETEIQKKTSPRKQKIIRSLVEAIAYRPRGLKKTEAGSPCWSSTGGG